MLRSRCPPRAADSNNDVRHAAAKEVGVRSGGSPDSFDQHRRLWQRRASAASGKSDYRPVRAVRRLLVDSVVGKGIVGYIYLACSANENELREAGTAQRVRQRQSRAPAGAQEESVKIRIEKAACVGNARCAAVSEELFPLNDDGYIAIDRLDVPEGQEPLARRGARACPERIIFIEEE
ncbi:MAG: ferredoxin [Solimonas sp.]